MKAPTETVVLSDLERDAAAAPLGIDLPTVIYDLEALVIRGHLGPKLLATAAQRRSQWADPGSTYFYPINGADQQRGIGPLLGRYPGDVYDGDTDAQVGDHPWAVSTANFAELYYRLAGQVTTAGTVPLDSLSAGFFSQVGVDASTTPAAAATALQAAGDQMLQAVIFHSDNLELSGQFDATSGYEKSVSNLSWSYASFLSAVRARTAI